MVAGRVLVAAMLCAASALAFALDVPYLSGRVVDEAEILSPAARVRIAELSRRHESRTGNQIAVLTMPTLEGTSIEEFAVEVFEKWQLGQKGVDNGVLILVAPSERRMRIEVGYGLEGTLTDLAASRIIRYDMTPRFKDGDFDGGIEAGVRAVVAVLEGGAAPAPPPAVDPGREQTSTLFEVPDLTWPERILIGCFFFGIIGLFTVIGVLTPGIGWFLYVFLIPFWAMFPIVVVGTYGALVLLVIYLVAFPTAKVLLRRSAWYRRVSEDLKTKGRANIGGFVLTAGGSSSSGGWSSGSSRSGGFSGGGGRSGGGGASGSW